MNSLFISEFSALINQIKAEYLNAKMDNNLKEITMHEHRLKSVKKILNIIKKLDFEITDIADVKGIPGLGAGSIRRIDEILKTGKLSEIDQKYSEKKHKKILGIQELTKVIGIGDQFAKKLVTDYKITSVVELKKAYESGEIELSDQATLGLKYYGIVQGNIPRTEIASIEKYLITKVHKLSPDLDIIICGSYRRGKKTSGDVDVLLYSTKIKSPEQLNKSFYLELLVNDLTEDGFILDNLTNINYRIKYMGFCKYKNNPVRRIDIRFIPYNSIYTAELYFTGPDTLNTLMRNEAKKRNMKLNEYGLYMKNPSDGKIIQIKINSEADVFKKLNMKYLSPEEREQYSTS